MRTRVFAALAAGTAVLVMLVLITVYAARARQLATDAGGPTGSTRLPLTHPGPDPDLVAIEAAAIRYRSSGDNGRSGVVAVIDRRCQDDQPGDRARCNPTRIPLDEQHAVAARLGGRPAVRFVPLEGDVEVGAPGTPFNRVVTLGPVARGGPGARIPYAMRCGPLCGYGTTLVLAQGPGGWVVTGETGVTWIS